MTRVVMVGPPGAGKGTQAVVLADKLAVPHISTGDLFRAHISAESSLGVQVKRYLDSGELVPDSVTNEMVAERLDDDDAAAGFVLDGFPRNTAQADVLAGLLADRNTQLDAVIELAVDEDELVKRLLARGRQDDTEEVIRNRQQVYRDETAPLLEYYAGSLLSVNGIGEVDEVSDRIVAALNGGQ